MRSGSLLPLTAVRKLILGLALWAEFWSRVITIGSLGRGGARSYQGALRPILRPERTAPRKRGCCLAERAVQEAGCMHPAGHDGFDGQRRTGPMPGR